MVLVLNLRCLDEAIGRMGFMVTPPRRKAGYLSLSLYCTQGFIETSQTLKIRKRKRERERERVIQNRYYLVSLIIIVILGCLIFWKPTYFGCHHSLCQKCGFQICHLLEHTGLSVSQKKPSAQPGTHRYSFARVPQSILHFEARIPQILHGSPIWRFVPANPTFYGHVFGWSPFLIYQNPTKYHTAGKENFVKFRWLVKHLSKQTNFKI